MHPIAALCVFLTTESAKSVESPHTPPPHPALGASIDQPPVAVAIEYPLAAEFVSAHPSNYVENGMADPEYVIIHQMEGTYESTLYWFQDPVSDVSTHYIMRSVDGEITQMVEHADMGQHIGGYNPISFGIEHEGFIYEPGWFTWEAYVSSAQLTRWLCDHFEIPADREHILGHVEVPGASHTDPGPYWDWDMYMALVHDVVPQARVEGVVVDATQPCTITATADTWITTTLEALDALDADEQCFLAAGTELSYLHASDEMISQARLTMDGGGPCAGMGTLDTEAYIYLPSFTPLCELSPLAAYDTVTVALDGVETSIDENGRFTFDDVAAGAHAIDVIAGDAWLPTSVPIEVAVYPGLRVVVPVSPGDPDDPGSDSSGNASNADDDEAGGSEGGGGTHTDTGGDSADADASDEGEPSATTDDGGPSDADTRGDASSGCGCNTTPHAPLSGLAFVSLVLARRRRRRADGSLRRTEDRA